MPRLIPGVALLSDALLAVARRVLAIGADPGSGEHYLPACAVAFQDSAGARSRRYFHWNPEDFPLAVHVPGPGDFGLAPEQAETCRQAVEAGIRAWQERAPELIRLAMVPEPAGAAVAPAWVDHFDDDVEGRCFFDVEADEAGRVRMRVTAFDLALRRCPGSLPPLAPYTVAELRRTATHEMGHALGLGHSRRDTDVMYPDFTAPGWAISDRDLRTLQMLYALPNGAPVRG